MGLQTDYNPDQAIPDLEGKVFLVTGGAYKNQPELNHPANLPRYQWTRETSHSRSQQAQAFPHILHRAEDSRCARSRVSYRK